MSQLVRRVEKLESITDKGVQRSVMVFSDEEVMAARRELGPNAIIIHIVPMTEPGREVVPYNNKGDDYVWSKKVYKNNQEKML